MTDDVAMFRDLVTRAIEAGHIVELADEFQVAPSTVERWAKGGATPLPRMQQMVIGYVVRVMYAKPL